MNTRLLSLDRISTLPDGITEKILTLMPIRDAMRTSILSTRWRYSWRSMPKLLFREDMVKIHSTRACDSCEPLKKYKLVSAILHVLLLHNGPTILEFNWTHSLNMHSEFDPIISYLAMGNKVKQLTIINSYFYRTLPAFFYSLHGLELIHLDNCGMFEPPPTFKGFSRLKSMILRDDVDDFTPQMLQRFISKCPLLEHISLKDNEVFVDEDYFVARGNKFTLADLVHCVPLIRSLELSSCYMKLLSVGGMPHNFPASVLAHLKHLFLEVCMMEHNQISSALCIIRSSPLLLKIKFMMYHNKKLPIRQTPTNFLDLEDYSDLKLDHLETLEIERFRNLPLEMEFVKLIMAKSPVLKKVQIELYGVSHDQELKMLRDLVQLPFPRTSPSAKLIFYR